MENSEQNDVAQTAANEAAEAQQQNTAAQAPLPTFEAINGDAQVVTPEVIAERAKKSGAAPLRDAVNANRRRREGDRAPKAGASAENAEAGEQGEKGKRGDRRPRRERSERPERTLSVPKRPVTSAKLENRREGLSSELADEFEALLAGQEVETLMTTSADVVAGADAIEEGTKVSCRIEKISKDSVFVNVGTAQLGLIPLKQFPEEMVLTIGQTFDAVVTKFNNDEGYYEVSLPLAAAEVGDWLSLTKGAIVEAYVKAAIKGGLEVEVGKLRGFMPAGQIATFYVENAEQCVGERWKCVVTEVNPERRNLIVSRRALMELERKELRDKTLAELEVGGTREGTVRKVIEVGAFVDLGGVDGFIHISQMGWGRVNKASDVVKEGDKVTVTILKIQLDEKNPRNDRISLSLRDAAKDPWKLIDSEYKVGDIVRGKVARIAEFGAFVELPIGVEGLVHISEIAYARVDKVETVLNVGDLVDVKILAIDVQKRKVSLSIKQTQEDPRIKERAEKQAQADAEAAAAEAEAKKKEEAELEATRERIRKLTPKKPLKGGLGRNDDADKFGLHF